MGQAKSWPVRSGSSTSSWTASIRKKRMAPDTQRTNMGDGSEAAGVRSAPFLEAGPAVTFVCDIGGPGCSRERAHRSPPRAGGIVVGAGAAPVLAYELAHRLRRARNRQDPAARRADLRGDGA